MVSAVFGRFKRVGLIERNEKGENQSSEKKLFEPVDGSGPPSQIGNWILTKNNYIVTQWQLNSAILALITILRLIFIANPFIINVVLATLKNSLPQFQINGENWQGK